MFGLGLLVILWALALLVLGALRARKAAFICHLVALAVVIVLFVLMNVFNAEANTKSDALGAAMLMIAALCALGAGLVADGIGSLLRAAADAIRGPRRNGSAQ